MIYFSHVHSFETIIFVLTYIVSWFAVNFLESEYQMGLSYVEEGGITFKGVKDCIRNGRNNKDDRRTLLYCPDGHAKKEGDEAKRDQ